VSVVTRQARRRWAAVVCGTAVLGLLPWAVAGLPVSASPVSATTLRARIVDSASLPYEGYAETTVDLGLPLLPDLQGVSRLLDGTTDQYAWYRSAGHWRADAITASGENDVYQAGRVTYLWNYSDNVLTRVLGAQPVRLPRAPDLLPPALARRLLGLASGADHLSRLPSQRVAGVDAAGLRLAPADPDTTVAAVDIWADPADGLPVEVKIMGRGVARPVLVTKFLQLSRRRPALAAVVPHPAPAVGEATAQLSSLNGILNGGRDHRRHPFPAELGGLPLVPTPGGLSDVAVYGAGFSRIALVPLPGSTGEQAASAASGAGAGSVTWPGGMGVLIRTPLLTVLLAMPDPVGRVTFLITGAVTPALLERAAADLSRRFAGPP
jgi:hypothetical protein